jgi:hypothetical protein
MHAEPQRPHPFPMRTDAAVRLFAAIGVHDCGNPACAAGSHIVTKTEGLKILSQSTT